MFDRLPRRGMMVRVGVGGVTFGFFGCAILRECIPGDQARTVSANNDLAAKLGLVVPLSLRPIPPNYLSTREKVFAGGTIAVDPFLDNTNPRIKIAWTYPESTRPIVTSPFPISAVSFGLAADERRRTIQFTFNPEDKGLLSLLRDIAGSNMALRDEALMKLQDYCSSVTLSLKSGEKGPIDQFLRSKGYNPTRPGL